MNSLDKILSLKARAAPPKLHAGGNDEIKEMLAEVDLLGLIQADTGESGHKSGDRYDFHNCPICGHHECFKFYPLTNTWTCFGASNSTGYTGGSYIDYLLATGRAADVTDAVKQLRGDTNHPYKSGATKGEDTVEEGADDRGDSLPKHAVLVEELLNRGFCFVNDTPCIPGEHGYEFGWDAIHRAILAFDPWSVERTRNEAIRTLVYRGQSRPAANHRFISFKNGVLDVRSMRFVTNGEFVNRNVGVIPVTIPHDYNENPARCDAVELLLDGISRGDAQVRANLEECVGLSMSRYTDDRAKAVWLYGTGQNGKSTFLDVLSFVVGDRNTCAVMLDDLKGRFNMQMLVGKLLVVSDDTPSGSLDKAIIGTIKKLVTGQALQIEQKGKDPYNAVLFATLIATSNEPPQMGDTTHGSMRRWHLIPLNANFGDAGSGRDVDLREKLRTEQAAQWLIHLGVEGLQRILANEGMTDTEYSRTAMQEARERSNNVFAFLADHPRDEMLAHPNVEVWYWRYCDETKERGGRPFEQAKFTQMVCTEYGLATANNGRYRLDDRDIGVNGIARTHGRGAGDKYRTFIEKRR